jgi:hypothetical protein
LPIKVGRNIEAWIEIQREFHGTRDANVAGGTPGEERTRIKLLLS